MSYYLKTETGLETVASEKVLTPGFHVYYPGLRFYKPSIGKWSSRDPLEEEGGGNHYCFVVNSPVLYVDSLGQMTSRPPKPIHIPIHISIGLLTSPSRHTIVCDGKGGVEIQIAPLHSAAERICVKPCIQKHEEYHRLEALKENPDICKGRPLGSKIIFTSPSVLASEETIAYGIEINCLKRMATRIPDCKCATGDRITVLTSVTSP